MKTAELVFIPAPGLSHLLSTLEFAKRLTNHGHRLSITVLVMTPIVVPNTDTYTNLLAASEPRIQLIQLPRVNPPPPELLKSPENYISLYIESHKSHVKDIVTNLISNPSGSNSVQLAGLVLDFFCMTMIDVGRELDLPSYLFLTSGAAFLALMLSLPNRHKQIGTEFSDSDLELVNPSFVNPVPVRVLPTPVFDKDGYSAFLTLAQRFRDTKGIIVNTFTELESYALTSFCDGTTPPIYAVGPVIDLKSKARPESDNIMKWLDEQPPSAVVFLCFGSMGSFSAPQLREIARGLEHSGFRFVWSMRQPLTQGIFEPPTDCTNPEAILTDGFIERTRGRGIVCGWVPQVEVLAHKAIGGFVSHCGWNSILESLWNGVPIVTWPLFAEQQLNAFLLVKELGLAVEMRLDYRAGGDLVMADEIDRAIKKVMECDSYVRKKAKDIKEKSRKALMDGGSSFNIIKRLIEDILNY